MTIINFFFIYYFCIVLSNKMTNMAKASIINNIVFSLILTIFMCIFHNYLGWLGFILPLFPLWIFAGIQSSNPQASFVAIIISFMTSFCIFAIISCIFIAIFPTFRNITYFPLLTLVTSCVQHLIIKQFFSLKRFKNGIPFFSSITFINYTTIIFLIFVPLIIYMSLEHKSVHIYVTVFIILVLTLAFLIYWWQAQITKSYRRRLELREQESLRTEVAELSLLVQKLSEDNERMARITHRDNTLITTLKNSTIQYLSTDFKNPAEAIAARDKLISNINALSQGRATLPDGYNTRTARVFDTGLSLLDELLHQMDSDAIQQNINFSVHNAVTLSDFVPSDVSNNDLVHTVDDLLKNAFKATKTRDHRMVQLQFYKLGKHLVVEVSDNGIPFEIISFMDMGIEKRTTYADGSGIGLIDIWNTKEKYRATYHIDEYKNPAPFSKKISLTFDKKNRYSIRTWRKDAILKVSRRIDLQVYDNET